MHFVKISFVTRGTFDCYMMVYVGYQAQMKQCLLYNLCWKWPHILNLTFLLWHTTSGTIFSLYWPGGTTINSHLFWVSIYLTNLKSKSFETLLKWEIRDSYMSYGSEASMEMEKNRRLQIFYGPFEMLVSLVCLLPLYLTLPPCSFSSPLNPLSV